MRFVAACVLLVASACVGVEAAEFLWKYKLPPHGHHTNLVVGQGLMTTCTMHYCLGVSSSAGTLVWNTTIPGGLDQNSKMVASATTAFVGRRGSNGLTLFVIDLATGSIVRRVMFGSPEKAPLVLASQAGIVFVSTLNNVNALNATTGVHLYSVDAFPTSRAAAGAKNFFAELNNENGGLRAYSLATGATQWTAQPIGKEGYATPITFDSDPNAMYIGAFDNCTIYSYDQSTGALNWRTSQQSYCAGDVQRVVWGIEKYGDTVLLISTNYIQAYAAATGAYLWNFTACTTCTFNVELPYVTPDGVIILANSATTYGVDATSGAKLWQINPYPAVSHFMPGVPAATKGQTVLAGFPWGLLLIDSRTGKVQPWISTMHSMDYMARSGKDVLFQSDGYFLAAVAP